MAQVVSLKNLLTNHWLKHDDEKLFHAYTNVKWNSVSVCGASHLPDELNAIIIPGSRSPCCRVCMEGLYGLNFSRPSHINSFRLQFE